MAPSQRALFDERAAERRAVMLHAQQERADALAAFEEQQRRRAAEDAARDMRYSAIRAARAAGWPVGAPLGAGVIW